MSVTASSVSRLIKGSWRIGLTKTTPTETAYIYLDGVLIGSTTAAFYDVHVPPGEAMEVWATGSATELPPVTYPKYFELAWERVTGADSYRVKKYNTVTAAWDYEGAVMASGEWMYSYRTKAVDDGESVRYQVFPIQRGIDGVEYEGAPFEFAFTMVRRPDQPAQTFTYDAETGLISYGS